MSFCGTRKVRRGHYACQARASLELGPQPAPVYHARACAHRSSVPNGPALAQRCAKVLEASLSASVKYSDVVTFECRKTDGH